jgi:hypothetical protein
MQSRLQFLLFARLRSSKFRLLQQSMGPTDLLAISHASILHSAALFYNQYKTQYLLLANSVGFTTRSSYKYDTLRTLARAVSCH